MELLDKKYMVTSIKGIDLILTRIKENLSLDYINELDKLVKDAAIINSKITNV